MFGVNNITRLEYTPSKGMNVILGGNGAGKSKLLLELTALPINKKHYKNGFKLITIEHNNSEYVLYSGNDKQSFKKDGEELNSNGLITTQGKLAIEHFHIDTDIRDLNLSAISFSTLSIQERKKWFTRISTTDYKFSISLFNKLKTLSRDLKGSVKLLNTKNLSIDNDLLSNMKVSLSNLKKQRDVLSNMNNSTIEMTPDPDFDYLPNIDVLLNNLEPMLTTEYTEEQVKSIIDIKNKDIEKLNAKLKTLTISDDDSIEAIENKIVELKKSKRHMEDSTHLIIENDVFDYMLEIRTDLLAMFDVIKYTDAEYLYVKENRDSLLNRATVLTERVAFLEESKAILEARETAEDIECSSCGHKWNIGFNAKEHALLVNKINISNKELEEVNEKLTKSHKEYNDARLSIEAIVDLKALISNIYDDKVRTVLYGAIGFEGYAMEINKLYVSLENSSIIYKFNKSIAEQTDKLTTQKLLNHEDIKRMKEEVSYLEDALGSLYTETSNLKDLLKEIIVFNKQRLQVKEMKLRLEEDISIYDSNTEKMLLNILHDLLTETIGVLDIRMNTLSNNISRVENDKAIIEFTSKKIESEKRRIEVVEDLIIALSPDGGIIAESLSNFMHIFIEDMNKIIESIWQYELKVLPCSVDDGDLDYIFKVKIPNNSLKDTVDDIRDLSTGQAEIVNFAFKLTTFNYLRILEAPIMLDEVFVNLEIKHKELAFKYIDELIESQTIGQTFMISHRDESHTTIDENTIFLDGVNTSSRLKINKVSRTKS